MNNNDKRKPVTMEEKALTQQKAKVRRLNIKLGKVKKITEHMESVVKTGKPVSSKQVEAWQKELSKLVNPPKQD